MFKKMIRLSLLVIVLYILNSYIMDLIQVRWHMLQTFIIMVAYVFYWIISIDKRISSRNSRFFLMSTGYMLLLYLIIQRMKYDIFNLGLARFGWYMYYIPMTYIPLFGYLCAKYLGNEDSLKLEIVDYIIIGINSCIVLGILTNDLHQWAFQLIYEAGEWTNHYTYGFLYYMTYIWIAFLSICMLYELYRKCTIIQTKHKIWIPLTVFFCGALYTVCYSILSFTRFTSYFPLTCFYCIFTVLVWESCMDIGLFPSNVHHKELFESSTISALITDKDYNPIYESIHARQVSPAIMRQASYSDLLVDKDTRLKSREVGNGHFLWFEDISYMNSLVEKSNGLRHQLAEENELLKAEGNLKAREESIRVQNSIYNHIVIELQDSIERISSYLNAEDDKALKKACVIGAYIKRKANLILLESANHSMDAAEISLCIKESLHYLEVMKIETGSIYHCEGNISLSRAKNAYDFFEEVIETTMDDIDSIFVNLHIENECITLKIVLEGNVTSCKLNTKDYHADILVNKAEAFYITFLQNKEGI